MFLSVVCCGRRLLEAAQQRCGAPAAMFELCVHNPDKGAIAASDIHTRVAAFAREGLPIALTDASLFTQKAALFQGAVFALGYDTAARIVNPKYYSNSEARMAAEFARLQAARCRFAVAGRAQDGRFLTLKDIEMHGALEDMDLFVEIPESEFRADISSTELRKQSSEG